MQICCSSPERFLKAGQDGWLEARPIKGTAKRHADDPEADQAAAQALVSSEKDRAENLMIVDLMRNDLGRVCQVTTNYYPHVFLLRALLPGVQPLGPCKEVEHKPALDMSRLPVLSAMTPAACASQFKPSDPHDFVLEDSFAWYPVRP